MSIARHHRRRAIALWTIGAVSGLTFPTFAQAGFFDFLFGPQTPAPAPYEVYPRRAYPEFRRRADHGFHRHAHKITEHRKLIAAVDTGHPVRPQAPTDIMDDDSLQHGDAVMTHAGIRIFVGYSGSHHRPEEFRKITEIKKLSQRERSALAALDAPGSNAAVQKAGDRGIATGRSASERGVSAGETITDPNGRTIRYVGP